MAATFRSAALASILVVTLFGVPSSLAECPEIPHHCRSTKDLLNVDVDDSELGLGTYEDDTLEKSESDDGLLLTSEDGSARPMSHDNGTRGELNTGDSGGVLIVVEDPGDADEFTVTFDEEPDGVEWSGDHFIVITGAEAGDHFVLPFVVTSLGDDLELDFTAEDDQGHSVDGTLEASVNGEDRDGSAWWTYLIAGIVLLIFFQFLRGRNLSSPNPPTAP